MQGPSTYRFPGTPEPDDVPLQGRALREAALGILLSWDAPLSITALLRVIENHGLAVAGPAPNKALAMALRGEVLRGRAVRVARGVYRAGVIPRTTAWRMRKRWHARAWRCVDEESQRRWPDLRPGVGPGADR